MNFDALPPALNLLLVLASIAALAKGADAVVEGAAALADRLGVSRLVIGLTVVSAGTSAPELAVSLLAAFQGRADISVGNIVGSNIFNLGFILGACALIRPLPTTRVLVLRDGGTLIATTLLLGALCGFDLELGRGEGLLLLFFLGAYVFLLYRQRGEGVSLDEVPEGDDGSSLEHLGSLAFGIAAVVLGSHVLVESSSSLARLAGLSDWVIGVTIVAAGTSAPELVTSLAGVLREEYAIGVGNLVGSDLFNLLGVLGTAAALRPLPLDPSASLSLASLAATVMVAVFFMRTGWKVSRLEGSLLLAITALRWWLDLTAGSA